MGMYVSVRGWIEVDHDQRAAAEAVIADTHTDMYSGGWAFPREPFNWQLYVFYGGDIREQSVSWLRDAVHRLAALPPVDDDRPCGLFVLTDERGNVSAWEIRDGTVHERDAPELAWTFRP